MVAIPWTKDVVNEIDFVMVNSSGTEVSGLGTSFTLQLAKSGGAFAASAGTKSELGSGWYRYSCTTSEADTEGPVSIAVTGSGCVQQNLLAYVSQATEDAVWANSTRTLTQTAASTESSTTAKITRVRGNTWTIAISGLSLSGYTTLDFMIKDSESDADTASILWIRKNVSGLNDGLKRLNGAAVASPYASTDASISVNVGSDTATITVKPIVTKDIAPKSRRYDFQSIISSVIATPASGTFITTGDITRAIS